MGFEKYIQSLSNTERLRVSNEISQFGDPNIVLTELFETESCFKSKQLDIRINKNFILWFKNRTPLSPAFFRIIKRDSITNCYYSYSVTNKNTNDNKIGLVFNNNTHIEFSVWSREDLIDIFNIIRIHVKGFESIEPYDEPQKTVETKIPCPYYKGVYVFKNNSIHLVFPTLFFKHKDKVIVGNIKDVIWCCQYSFSSDATDGCVLKLYFRNNKKTCVLYSDTEYGVYQLAIELKKRAPHLLYGYNEKDAK